MPGEVNFKAALRPTPKPTSSPGPPTASNTRPQPQQQPQQPQQQPPPWVLITSTTGMGLEDPILLPAKRILVLQPERFANTQNTTGKTKGFNSNTTSKFHSPLQVNALL